MRPAPKYATAVIGEVIVVTRQDDGKTIAFPRSDFAPDDDRAARRAALAQALECDPTCWG